MIVWKNFFSKLGKLIFAIMVFTAAFQWWKPVPDFLPHEGATVHVPEQSVHFFADATARDKDGKRVIKQQIWDHIFSSIAHSEQYIFLDMFLVNDFQGKSATSARPLSHELAESLINKKAVHPQLPITFITDPINTVYGGVVSSEFSAMEKAGINIIVTNLAPLRDSNLLASALWRPFFSWFENSTEGGRLPHPFTADGQKVTLRSWIALLNFKANHSKLLVYDRPIKPTKSGADHKLITLITSSNPHDASSAHGNVALEVDDQLWRSALEGESAVARLGGDTIAQYDTTTIQDEDGPIAVTLLHEKGIKTKVIELLESSKRGDSLSLAMFYLSERDVTAALVEAGLRGVDIRVILDPNNDAFGFTKNGIPNRPVARELLQKSRDGIKIRWCDTHGEQCHAKLFLGRIGTTSFMLLGSANFTRRNLDDFNIETSAIASSDKEFAAHKDAQAFFDMLWESKSLSYTVPYETFADTTWWKISLAHFMEISGLSSF